MLLNKSYFESPEEREERLLAERETCGFFKKKRENGNYVVLSILLQDKDGRNCTQTEHMHGVNRILHKYVEALSFYIDGRIVTVVYATPHDMQKYLHILANDVVQSMERILGFSCGIGIGKITNKLTGLYDSCMDSARALSEGRGREDRIFYISDMKLTEGTPDVCEKALEKIREEFADPDISLISVSAATGISPNYLSTLIKKKTGKSFIDYLTGQRMEAAENMIRSTDMRIREISERCGYNDRHYFSYCFKKYAGISPNMLRRSIKEQ